MGNKTLIKNIATVTIGVLDKTDKVFSSIRWITTANLLSHNTLAGYEYGLSYRPSISLLVQKGDILVRRIAPSYINYIQDIAPNAYIANNVIIIRPKEGQIDPKYLAYYLDKNIEKIIKKAAKGTTLPTLTRQDLEEFEITLPDERTQYLIGNLWYLENEKIKLYQELKNIENKKIYYLLNKCIKNL
jgi:restriction endonuclease S subunit